MSAVPPPIVNVADLEFRPRPYGTPEHLAERYDAKLALVGAALGAKKLGYNVTRLAPGARAFPFHNHLVNEELFYVIEGRGEIRYGDARRPIRAGDLIACPAGNADTAHQIVNSSDAELTYLAVSTKIAPDIAEYPDTGKFAFMADRPADAEGNSERVAFVGRFADSRDYWEGES